MHCGMACVFQAQLSKPIIICVCVCVYIVSCCQLGLSVIMSIILVPEKEAEKAKERQAAEDSDDVDMADQEEPVEPKVELKEVSCSVFSICVSAKTLRQ